MKAGLFLQIVVLVAVSLQVRAEIRFADMVRTLGGDKEAVVAEVPNRQELSTVKTMEEAAAVGRLQTYEDMLARDTAQVPASLDAIMALAKKEKNTIVIVPGLLGEFIDTRAFEEVFARNSSEKTKWLALMKSNRTTDARYNLEVNSNEAAPLSDLIDVASVDDKNGNPLVKLVILKTKLGSFESLGQNSEKAAIFNRRLQKYLDLTQDQKLILLGYSRGTPLALEMISQAETQKLAYLSKVKAVVAYAGVVMGSSLADLTDDTSTQSGRQFVAIKKLLASLKTSDFFIDRAWKGTQNTAALANFLKDIAVNSDFDPNAFLNTTRSGDFNSVSMLVIKVLRDLSAMSVIDFNGHVLRVRKFLSEILASVDGLKSKSRVAWFQSHALPKSIQYYSISATMVDPEKSAIEAEIYNRRVGYNETLDDASLLGNRRTYEKATGFAMNDSQVAIHQSTFMPEVLKNLNPQNTNLHMEALALMQTHHWGVSLRTVNVMRDGRVNPFPRENNLVALAAFLNQRIE